MKNVWRNIAWLIAERGLQIIGALVITALMARSLGPADFGLFQYAQALVFVASALTMVCGAEVLVPRLTTAIATGQHARATQLLRQGLLLRLAGAATGYAGLLAWCGLHPETPATAVVCAVLGLSLWLREPSGVVIAWSQAQTHNRPVVLIHSAALGVRLLLVALACTLGWASPVLLAAVFATESALVALMLWRLYARQQHLQTPPQNTAGTSAGSPDSASIGTGSGTGIVALARQGMLYFVGLLGMMLMRRLDQIMLKDQIDPISLGAWAAAMQITDHVILLASIVAAAAAPRLVYAVADARTARRHVLALSLGLCLAGTAAAALLTVLAPLIVRLIYGQAFAQTVTLLQGSAWLAPLAFAEAGLNLGLLRQQRARQVAIKWLSAAALTGLVNALAIPVWGAPGALAGLACGFGVALLFSLRGLWATDSDTDRLQGQAT